MGLLPRRSPHPQRESCSTEADSSVWASPPLAFCSTAAHVVPINPRILVRTPVPTSQHFRNIPHIVHDSPGLSALGIGAQLGSEGPSRLLRPTIATATTGPAATSMLLMNQRYKASRRCAGSNSEDLGRAAMHAHGGRLLERLPLPQARQRGKPAAYPSARSQGHSWAPTLSIG